MEIKRPEFRHFIPSAGRPRHSAPKPLPPSLSAGIPRPANRCKLPSFSYVCLGGLLLDEHAQNTSPEHLSVFPTQCPQLAPLNIEESQRASPSDLALSAPQRSCSASAILWIWLSIFPLWKHWTTMWDNPPSSWHWNIVSELEEVQRLSVKGKIGIHRSTKLTPPSSTSTRNSQ